MSIIMAGSLVGEEAGDEREEWRRYLQGDVGVRTLVSDLIRNVLVGSFRLDGALDELEETLLRLI